jgi:hypothetical protein
MRPIHPLRKVPTLALFCCAAGLASCGSDADDDPTSPSIAAPSSPELQAQRSQQQITGVAFITLVEAGNAAERFTFSAVRHRDGRISGQFQLFTEQEGGIRLHGKITCLGIRSEGGELIGHLSATVTKSSEPLFEGLDLVWTVVDRGEGAGAALPDLASDLFIATPEEVEGFCAFEFGLPINESERGNIQVHP